MSKLNLKWINSAGGPLILMEKNLLIKWNGINELKTNSNQQTDYERACEVEDYVGLIDLDSEKALVLGDMPMETTWLQADENDGIIVCWNYADSRELVHGILETISFNQNWEDTKIEMTFKTSEIILFDSAFSHDFFIEEESLKLNLNPGKYIIQTHFYEPDPKTSLVLHRIVNKRNLTSVF